MENTPVELNLFTKLELSTKLLISSGQGVIPYRRYTPQAIGTNRLDSGGDSKVWMKEDNNITFDVEPWDYSGVFY